MRVSVCVRACVRACVRVCVVSGFSLIFKRPQTWRKSTQLAVPPLSVSTPLQNISPIAKLSYSLAEISSVQYAI